MGIATRPEDVTRERAIQAVLMGSAFTLSATAAAYLIFKVVLAGASVCVTLPK